MLRNLFLFQILFNFFFYFSLNKFTDFLHDETKIYWQKLKKIKTERQKGDTIQNKIDQIFFNFFTSRVFSRKREVHKNGSSYVVIFLLLFRTNISHLELRIRNSCSSSSSTRQVKMTMFHSVLMIRVHETKKILRFFRCCSPSPRTLPTQHKTKEKIFALNYIGDRNRNCLV